jgi:hypothetical protein
MKATTLSRIRMKTKHPALTIHARNTSYATPSTDEPPSTALRTLTVALLIALLAACGSPAVAADAPSASPPLSISPEQQQRLDAMRIKGPEASVCVLPIMIAGRPFDRATDVLGVLLEQQGLQHIELGRTPFTAGVKAEMRVLSGSLAAFLRTNPIAADYALYAELNGATLDEVRAVVMDKAGEMVWADHQTTKDRAFQALGPHRDPMTLIGFLVERLRPPFGLNEGTARKRSHTLEDGLKANSPYAPTRETEGAMSARLKTMKESGAKASLKVLGVRMHGRVSIASASDLAKRITEAKLFHTATAAHPPVLLEASLADGDQQKYLWAIAREFQAYLKQNPPDADYVLYADYMFNRQRWQEGGLQFVVCDRRGEWVMAELANSDHRDYQRAKPISAEGCDRLLVERLAARLH